MKKCWRLVLALSTTTLMAAELPDWQGADSWYGLKEDQNAKSQAVGGLAFQWGESLSEERPAGWSYQPVNAQSKHRGYIFGSTDIEGRGESIYGGFLEPSRRALPHVDYARTWAHTVLTYPAYRVHVSRVTPALVVETEEAFIGFSNPGGAFPAWFFYGIEGGGSSGINFLTKGETHKFEPLELPETCAWILFGYGDVFEANRAPPPWLGNWQTKGIEYKGDKPLLFVFSKPPESLEVSRSGDGVAFHFESEGVSMAMVQPFGRFDQAIPTMEWQTPAGPGVDAKLPAQAEARCTAWAEMLRSVPVDVKETFSVKDDGGVVIRQSFVYLDLDGNAPRDKRWMPIPPIWALAMQEGFELKIPGEVDDTGAYTYAGPYMGMWGDGTYEAVFPGLDRYWRETRVFGEPDSDPEWLAPYARKLEREARKTVEAGHLAPWLYNPLHRNVQLQWPNSAQTPYYLVEALPALPVDIREQVFAYVRAEDGQYPSDTDKWWLSYNEGARRESAILDETFKQRWASHFARNFYNRNSMIPVETLYYLAALYRELPENGLPDIKERWPRMKAIIGPHLGRLDWASGFFFTEDLGERSGVKQHSAYGSQANCPLYAGTGGPSGVRMLNRWFSGVVGYARLAHMAGDSEGVEFAQYLLARATVSRYTAAVFSRNLYRHGLRALPDADTLKEIYSKPGGSFEAISRKRFYEWHGPEDDVSQVVRLDGFGVRIEPFGNSYNGWFPAVIGPFTDMTPELGRFLRENDATRETSEAYIRAWDRMPDWYATKVEDHFGAEQGFEWPEVSLQLILARLWVLGEAPEDVARYIDVPWTPVGDCYQMHKLAELIKAARGAEWE